MTRLLTKHIATMTELREPHKVLERAGGETVAILKNSALVAYLVPADAVHAEKIENASTAEVMKGLDERQEQTQPVLDYLKDKYKRPQGFPRRRFKISSGRG